ncbi:MAG TPA: hypothetical protein VF168_06835 [Trueperaceae bacterium]
MTKKVPAEAGKSSRRNVPEGETRKQQIARRLKLNERVLEQYFQSKQAELEEGAGIGFVPASHERVPREKRI